MEVPLWATSCPCPTPKLGVAGLRMPSAHQGLVSAQERPQPSCPQVLGGQHRFYPKYPPPDCPLRGKGACACAVAEQCWVESQPHSPPLLKLRRPSASAGPTYSPLPVHRCLQYETLSCLVGSLSALSPGLTLWLILLPDEPPGSRTEPGTQEVLGKYLPKEHTGP